MVQKIVIKPIVEPRTALLSLLAGEIALSEVATQDAAQLEGAEGIAAVTTSRIDYTWIRMNVEKPSPGRCASAAGATAGH